MIPQLKTVLSKNIPHHSQDPEAVKERLERLKEKVERQFVLMEEQIRERRLK
jgi:hypothetical protein